MLSFQFSCPLLMKSPQAAILDGNEAAVSVAYRLSETIAIYPITPSSPMAETADEWSAQGRLNLLGSCPSVIEMQSEGGAAGAVHGMLQAGSLTTTFTASQGLLLMIPNMYKIAGELLPFVMHVTARALATHALSIFGDHSDVMACRQTGFAMLASNNVQEAQDMAAIAHAATLQCRVPFMHFFDGFRTSHEINTLDTLSDAQLRNLVDVEALTKFRQRALTPDKPSVRGTAQNPDVFFQAREAANPFYEETPKVVKAVMAQFARETGRTYQPFEYVGHPAADRVIVAMGSACETVGETVRHLNERGVKVGMLVVRLYRPWSLADFVTVLPRSVRSVAVLDRTKEPGAVGEPLYLDVVAAIEEARATGRLPDAFAPTIIGGRYGLGSKEFTPAMAKGVFDELAKPLPKRRFTIGINDDVTALSLDYDPAFDLEKDDVFRAVFYGIGSDGTVGANKNSIKIIGEGTDAFAQAYFVYDSKKSGGMTTSHLRFGPEEIRAPYLIQNARFVACHQFSLMERYDVLQEAAEGAVLLLNSIFPAERLWDHLPQKARDTIIEKRLQVYTIDAYAVAKATQMGGRINTIMQTCFFAISGILPRDEAIAQIKAAIKKTYGKKGDAIVQKNFAAVDAAVENMTPVPVPEVAGVAIAERYDPIDSSAPDFVQQVTRVMLANEGDLLPVSAVPVDGVWPVGTTKYEKRNIAQEIPEWDSGLCIQCNKCAFVCPHAAIRSKFYPEDALEGAPEGFASTTFKARDVPYHQFTIQVAPEDCTGCGLCVEVCPAKDKEDPVRRAINMTAQQPIRERERANLEFFLDLPEPDLEKIDLGTVKGSQFKRPLIEFSGACAGCGETPYLKALTQLYGDRLIIANATGCSSIFGGNLPTTPYTTDAQGRGPAWANSLFEDNAEFGLGIRLAVDHKRDRARELVSTLAGQMYPGLVSEILEAEMSSDAEINRQRDRIKVLREWLSGMNTPDARELEAMADYLVDKSLWIVGGDGWAYDIGYGGLDHVLASGVNVNVLVLDTGTYSNTGGQQSKATPTGAVAKFAAGGKALPRKNLGFQALMYGHVYVAQVAMGAKDSQTVAALRDAAAFNGPSLVIAYSHCISHGFELCSGLEHQRDAVASGVWNLFRFDPSKRNGGGKGKPFSLDSKSPTMPLVDFMAKEGRFHMLCRKDPERAAELAQASEAQLQANHEFLQDFAKRVAAASTR